MSKSTSQKFTHRTSAAAFGLTLMAMAGASHASLIDQGLSTLDDVTNLEWLDVTATVGFSYDGAIASSYATVDGYRHATQSEIVTLYTNAGITGIGGGLSSSNFNPAASLTSLLGVTAVAGPENLSQGWFDNGSSGATTSVAEVSAYYSSGGFGQAQVPNTYPVTNYATSEYGIYGNYMVRASVVPVPAAVWLFGSGLVGLVGFARRKKA